MNVKNKEFLGPQRNFKILKVGCLTINSVKCNGKRPLGKRVLRIRKAMAAYDK